MVRDGKMSFKKYFEAARVNLEFEEYSTVQKMIFNNLESGVKFFTPLKFRENLKINLFEMTLKLIKSCNLNNKNKLILLK